jgi:hypothetical protein
MLGFGFLLLGLGFEQQGLGFVVTSPTDPMFRTMATSDNPQSAGRAACCAREGWDEKSRPGF